MYEYSCEYCGLFRVWVLLFYGFRVLAYVYPLMDTVRVPYGNVVDFSFIFSLYVSDLSNVTKKYCGLYYGRTVKYVRVLKLGFIT